MESPRREEQQCKICSLDGLAVGNSYSFDPPLDIAVVRITSKHRLGLGEPRHPNFLAENIRTNGVSNGKLINKSDYDASGEATATFSCEATFDNRHTKKVETIRYSATCKFSRRAVEGTQVQVRELVQERLRDGRNVGECE
jgi:hypothetical protein